VRELVVSAGQSVEVTLPRNEVELNVFVVLPPPPGKTVEILDQLFEVCTCYFSSFVLKFRFFLICCRLVIHMVVGNQVI